MDSENEGLMLATMQTKGLQVHERRVGLYKLLWKDLS
jgi:hypothetical protein